MKHKIVRISPEYSDIDDIIHRYHFSEDDRPLIKSLYQKHFSRPQVQIAYDINPEIEGIDLDDFAVAIVTLGAEIDEIINSYVAKEQILETYILDAIAVKILSRAYTTLVKDVNRFSGKTVSSLEFIGDRFPMELTEAVLDYLKPDGVSLKEGYMLSPLKTVCMILPLKEGGDNASDNVEKICNTCSKCGNLKCIMRNST
ncbi:MAG: hypothetical protein K6D38_06170 [Pseudobutyrivibrio sp.]|nr:hypothetical protein [Pseudobutyrivibrio sp.]